MSIRRVATGFLVLVALACLGADLLAPLGYAEQLRELPDAPPSLRFPLGTDALGRDRLARLLHGGRISLTLAPAAALLSTLLAALLGTVAGLRGGAVDRLLLAAMELLVCLPWLLLLLAVRALLPLAVPGWLSLAITFGLLGLLGWAAPARVVRASAASLRLADFVAHARALGCPPVRLLTRHVWPNLWPVLRAQFWLAIPAYILSEANLGLLGLGIAEPLPSWGTLLRDMESFAAVRDEPWRLAPVVVLALVVASFQAILPKETSS